MRFYIFSFIASVLLLMMSGCNSDILLDDNDSTSEPLDNRSTQQLCDGDISYCEEFAALLPEPPRGPDLSEGEIVGVIYDHDDKQFTAQSVNVPGIVDAIYVSDLDATFDFYVHTSSHPLLLEQAEEVTSTNPMSDFVGMLLQDDQLADRLAGDDTSVFISKACDFEAFVSGQSFACSFLAEVPDDRLTETLEEEVITAFNNCPSIRTSKPDCIVCVAPRCVLEAIVQSDQIEKQTAAQLVVSYLSTVAEINPMVLDQLRGEDLTDLALTLGQYVTSDRDCDPVSVVEEVLSRSECERLSSASEYASCVEDRLFERTPIYEIQQDNIIDICDELDCFTADDNLYSYSLTIYVDQPVNNSTQVYTLSPATAGHVFIGLAQIGAEDYNYVQFGYYPAESIKSLFSNTTDGVIVNDGLDPLGEPWQRSYDVSISYLLDASQLSAIIAYFEENFCNSEPTYSLDLFNCLDFAIAVADAAGLTLPDNASTWPGGGGSAPSVFGQDLRALPDTGPYVIDRDQGLTPLPVPCD